MEKKEGEIANLALFPKISIQNRITGHQSLNPAKAARLNKFETNPSILLFNEPHKGDEEEEEHTLSFSFFFFWSGHGLLENNSFGVWGGSKSSSRWAGLLLLVFAIHFYQGN